MKFKDFLQSSPFYGFLRIVKKNLEDEPTLSMKVLKGPKQIEREKAVTIWDLFDRLQRSLAPLRKGKQIKKGVHRIQRIEKINILDPK